MKALFLLCVLILCGCQAINCTKPYILVGRDCCLDTDDNKICDKDEVFEEQSKVIVTEAAKPKVVEKTVRQYVCPNGQVVDLVSKCPEPIKEEVKEEAQELPEVATNNEEGTTIQEVTVRPACTDGMNGGEIYYKVGTVASSIAVLAREADGEYKELYLRPGLYDGFIYFTVCEGCQKTSFALSPGKIYVLKLKFDQTNIYNRVEYSNEHIVDTRPDSLFLTKECSG